MKSFQLCTIEYDVSCGLVTYSLYHLEVRSFCTQLVERFSFNQKWTLNFVKCFFCIYWDNSIIFQFCSSWCDKNIIDSIYHIASKKSWSKSGLYFKTEFSRKLLAFWRNFLSAYSFVQEEKQNILVLKSDKIEEKTWLKIVFLGSHANKRRNTLWYKYHSSTK